MLTPEMFMPELLVTDLIHGSQATGTLQIEATVCCPTCARHFMYNCQLLV